MSIYSNGHPSPSYSFLDWGGDETLVSYLEKQAKKNNTEDVEDGNVTDTRDQFEKIKVSAVEGISSVFPVEGEKHTLKLHKVWVDDNKSANDYSLQKKTKLEDKTYGVPVYGEVSLIDKETGKTINTTKKVKLMDLPKLTTRQTFIVKGSEWNLPTQFRLKPGVYTVNQANGLPKTQINLGAGGRGRKMEVHMDDKKGNVLIQVGSSNIPLYPVLIGMGHSHEEISESWGKEVADANKALHGRKTAQSVVKFSNKFLDTPADITKEEAVERLNEHFDTTSLDPEMTKLTLRKPYAKLESGALMDASSRLIATQQGREKVDDRDNLMFKSVHSAEDIFKERFQVNRKMLASRMKRAIDSKDKVRDILAVPHIKKLTEGIFNSLAISERSEQHNPIQLINEQYKTTIMGEGALGSLDMVKTEARSLHPSELGKLDPIKTPESAKIGAVNYLTIGAEKRGNELTSVYINHKTMKPVQLSAVQSHDKKIAYPDQFKVEDGKIIFRDATTSQYFTPDGGGKKVEVKGKHKGKVKVQHKGVDKIVPISEVDFIIPSEQSVFTFATAQVPFLDSMSGGRAFLASKHTEQTTPVLKPEVPLVQSSFGSGETVESSVGRAFSATSPIKGIVKRVGKDSVDISGKDGIKTVPLYNNFKLNEKSFFHHTPNVEVGDKVEKNGLIGDLNFTKNGVLALGLNTSVAYMAGDGSTMEDGIKVSEGYQKKMTHQQIIEEKSPKGDDFIYDRDKYGAAFPGSITNAQSAKLSANGVVKKGQILNYGDPIFAAMRLSEDTSEDRILKKLGRGLVKPQKDASIKWEYESPGEVMDVVENTRQYKVQIKVTKQLEVGDKLCFDKEHEILTIGGWKNVADVTTKDRVASLHAETDTLEYVPVDKAYAYPHAGNMYRVETTQVSMSVTENHSVFAKRRGAKNHSLTEAYQLKGKRYRLQNNASNWVGEDIDYFSIDEDITVRAGQSENGTRRLPSIDMEMEQFMFILGAYLAEGNCFKDEKRGNFGIVIHQVKPHTRILFEEELDFWGMTPCSNDTRYIFYGRQLQEYFSQFGLCDQKFIPNWIFSLDKKYLKILYRWMMWGDGSETSTGHSYCTTSKQLADDFQRLTLHIGMASNIKKTVYENGWKDCFNVYVYRFKNNPTINHGHSKNQSGQKESYVYYEDEIYCVRLEKNHILYTRRNGKCHWSGNSGRHGNKGVISAIVPNSKMPQFKNGEAVEVILNPMGVIGRTNPSQILETLTGKVADKQGGKPIMVENFKPSDNHAGVMKLLKDAGLKQTEELFDPETGKSMGEITTGKQYMMKLVKTGESGFSARQPGEGYDLNKQPVTGGKTGSKALDPLSTWSMLSHGANHNLREMATHKAEQSDEFWRAIQLGQQTPPPQVPFTWNKFDAMLRGAGVNMTKNGSMISTEPIRDKDVLSQSAGEITDPKMLRGKGLKEHVGGLFDPEMTGGVKGDRWTHIALPEELPNPLFKDPIKKLTGINDSTYKSVVTGKKYVAADGTVMEDLESYSKDQLLDMTGITRKAYAKAPGVDDKTRIINTITEPDNTLIATGGPGITNLLRNVDLAERKIEAESMIKGSKGSTRNSNNRTLRYINSLEKADRRPEEAYMTKNVAVLPPQMRPVYRLQSGDLGVSPLNYLYRDLGLTSNQLKEMDDMDDEMKKDLRGSLYQGLEALVGVSGSTALTRPAKGIISTLSGDSPKTGYIQRNMWRKQQEPTGRGVIAPDPNLGIDEVAIPKEMAKKIFRPFLVRKMTGTYGLSMADSLKRLNVKKDDIVDKALQEAMNERPVILNRAPSLHKYSVQAFNAKVTPGKTILIPNMIVKGFNADFDGDQMNIHVPVTPEAVAEANRMKPSNILFTPARIGDAKIMNYLPQDMAQLGIYELSVGGGKNLRKAYASVDDVKKDIDNKDISYKDSVMFNGKRTVAGRVLINDLLPKENRNYNTIWKKKEVNKLAMAIAEKDKVKASVIIDALRKLGDRYSSNQTMTMDDIRPVSDPKRKAIMKRLKNISGDDSKSRDAKSKEMLKIVDRELVPVIDKFGKENSNLYEWLESGATSKKGAVMQQISGPTIVSDHTGAPIPIPIENSYSEGLSVSEYIGSSYGARAGMIGRALSTAQPGYQNKLMLNAVGDQTISNADCGDKEGIEMDVSDPQIIDRYEIGTNRVVDPQIVADKKRKKIKTMRVRSPMTCKNAVGICAKCYGPNEEGKAYGNGSPIGIIASQSIGEPLTQQAMKKFHTGGVYWNTSDMPSKTGHGEVDSFKRIQQLTQMPKNLPGKTMLSAKTGVVEEIVESPGGGFDFVVSGKKYTTPVGQKPIVRKGSKVTKGDPLTTGYKDPYDVLETQGMRATQNFLVQSLQDAYGDNSLKRKNFEVVVRGATNTAVVEDPGLNDEFSIGDIVSWSLANDINKNPVADMTAEDAVGFKMEESAYGFDKGHKISLSDLDKLTGKKIKVKRNPMKIKPELYGVKQLPQVKPDWLAALGQEGIQKTIMESAATSGKSSIHGSNPIPGFMYGAEFGLGEDGSY